MISLSCQIITDAAMRLQAVLLSLLLSEASSAPRKKRDIGVEAHEHPHHAVSFFDSFFSFFGGGSDSSPITSTQVGCSFNAILFFLKEGGYKLNPPLRSKSSPLSSLILCLRGKIFSLEPFNYLKKLILVDL